VIYRYLPKVEIIFIQICINIRCESSNFWSLVRFKTAINVQTQNKDNCTYAIAHAHRSTTSGQWLITEVRNKEK